MAKYTNAIQTVASSGTPVRVVTTPTMCRNVLIQAPSANGTKKLFVKDYPAGNVIAEVAAGGAYQEASQNDANDIDASSIQVDADTNGAQFYFTHTTN